MKLRNALLSLLFILPVTMFASISGTYKVEGFDPSTQSKYTGTVVIQKRGQTYSAIWTFPSGNEDIATGVRKGDHISFVFQEHPTNDFGVQQYEIDGDILKGPWARFGINQKGFEKIQKND